MRPLAVASLTSSNAGGETPFKAGSGNFALTATTANKINGHASGYTGTLKIDNAAIEVISPATAAGQVSPLQIGPATSAISSSTATGSNYTYSEVGKFRLLGYSPLSAGDYTKPRGVFDGVMSATECAGMNAAQCDLLKAATWSGIDSISTERRLHSRQLQQCQEQ